MQQLVFDGPAMEWLTQNSQAEVREIEKQSPQTKAWFGVVNEQPIFIKWYPEALRATWAQTETAIAGSVLHRSIVPLHAKVECRDGTLLVYPKVTGENLGPQEVRSRFQRLPVPERVAAVVAVAEALTAVWEAGFMIVDWYEGNMIYDFEAHHIWLFDWELCRSGGSFVLEMESNYGSSRLMAPEEFVCGSRLDQCTLVYNLGRYTLLTLPELAAPPAPVVAQATYPVQSQRFSTLRAYVAALADALTRCETDGNSKEQAHFS